MPMACADLVELLQVCVRGAMAAQRYIILELLQLDSSDAPRRDVRIADFEPQSLRMLRDRLRHVVTVGVKGQLAHKEGTAANDLVTTADIVTQTVLERALADAFPDMPFTLVGEEDANTSAAIASQVDDCMRRFLVADFPIPLQADLNRHACTESRLICAETYEELRSRIGVFLDPIDGTNCFVDGHWTAPLTLVGITLDGLPVAGVVNRLFYCTIDDVTCGSGAECGSLSYVWNDASTGPFLLHEGRRVLPRAAPVRDTIGPLTPLRVVRSGTTSGKCFDRFLLQLQPVEPRSARGAGNKLMLLVASGLHLSEAATNAACDVFVAPECSISKWDTCGPHAFLLAVGGDICTLRGEPIRCLFKGADTAKELLDGVVAVTRWSMAEVLRRMHW
ncbi:unnamed protein product [Trypanosoma congolense IL3000]|uniref:3'(2'),5'-bisphosphate nucleotidase n=1 Tax=Trypanosoma congolense (strain IL3000) TaxID=1068625 RepID=F9WDP0_TRYCI|nr:unnamed protein product [Trypanosoma congolense IL3000]